MFRATSHVLVGETWTQRSNLKYTSWKVLKTFTLCLHSDLLIHIPPTPIAVFVTLYDAVVKSFKHSLKAKQTSVTWSIPKFEYFYTMMNPLKSGPSSLVLVTSLFW